MSVILTIFVFCTITSGHLCQEVHNNTTTTIDNEDFPVVQILQGKIKGKSINIASGNNVHAFLGIPYAQPPIGRLRFKPPVKAEPWNDVLDATTLPDACMQRDMAFLHLIPAMKRWLPTTEMSEDCLKLNVWVPEKRSSNSTLPVLVFIHGGKFSSGATSIPAYDGTYLASEENIIVVTMNYRLNSFGFLNLGCSDAPGNVGFLDQVLALEWIRHNIRYFGGDSTEVTLSGHSAGAVSVGFHLVSPKSNGLFKRVIVQSGGATADWIIQDRNQSLSLAMKLADSLMCPKTSNFSAVVQCLQNADPFEIIDNEPFENYEFSVFRPTVDGTFLTESPKMSYRNKSFSKSDVLIGVTKEEGTLFLTRISPVIFSYFKNEINVTHKDTTSIIRKFYPDAEEHVYKAVELFYTNWHNPEDPVYNLYASNCIVGDVNFVCSINDMADLIAENGNRVFKYMYAHRSSGDLTPKWMGSYHGSDLVYIFGDPVKVGPSDDYTQDEVDFSRRLMRYWANFVRTGNPNTSIFETRSWPMYTTENKEYFVLAPHSSVYGHKYRDRVCTFWNDVFPHITNVSLHW